ncbi:rhomboid family protein [Thermotalea metallivorans]|uniref:Rhomboid protease GluP n=1 Tax=Thermotalea metallivorans TaxID=520762 RepID=A0A140L1H9_9FIRM|nr:rhomboid family intramembrane serine protease [Thermotalea metallivorans]KXG74404.1 Rhomboid protease GluP [Thermotalea metallivorans]
MFEKSTALLMKYFIEEKEFFLYPYQPIKDITDVILHKQLWFQEYFLEFLNGDLFLQRSFEGQKNHLYTSIKKIQINNRWKKLFFYKILLLENHDIQEQWNQLKDLCQWIDEEKINLQLIFIHLPSGQIIRPYSNFEDQEQIVSFLTDCLARIPWEEPEYIDLLEIESATKQTKGYYFPKKKFYVTTLLLGVNILIWLYMSLTGSTTDTYHLIEFGAKYNPLIADGQYYRLFTSMFLHIGILHLMFNSYALNMLGKDVEAIYGTLKFLAIYLIAGIFGSLESFLFSNAVSAGASGAIFGLMGAYIYFGIRRPAIFSARYGLNLVSLLLINIIFGLTTPGIDNFAHLGGFFGGFLASWALGLKKEQWIGRKRLIPQILVLLLFITSLWTGVKIQQDTWQYHLHKGVGYLREENLAKGQEHLEKGMSLNPDVAEFPYYLAYVYYRKGNIPAARHHLERALALDPQDEMARQFLQELEKIQ